MPSTAKLVLLKELNRLSRAFETTAISAVYETPIRYAKSGFFCDFTTFAPLNKPSTLPFNRYRLAPASKHTSSSSQKKTLPPLPSSVHLAWTLIAPSRFFNATFDEAFPSTTLRGCHRLGRFVLDPTVFKALLTVAIKNYRSFLKNEFLLPAKLPDKLVLRITRWLNAVLTAKYKAPVPRTLPTSPSKKASLPRKQKKTKLINSVTRNDDFISLDSPATVPPTRVSSPRPRSPPTLVIAPAPLRSFELPFLSAPSPAPSVASVPSRPGSPIRTFSGCNEYYHHDDDPTCSAKWCHTFTSVPGPRIPATPGFHPHRPTLPCTPVLPAVPPPSREPTPPPPTPSSRLLAAFPDVRLPAPGPPPLPITFVAAPRALKRLHSELVRLRSCFAPGSTTSLDPSVPRSLTWYDSPELFLAVPAPRRLEEFFALATMHANAPSLMTVSDVFDYSANTSRRSYVTNASDYPGYPAVPADILHRDFALFDALLRSLLEVASLGTF